MRRLALALLLTAAGCAAEHPAVPSRAQQVAPPPPPPATRAVRRPAPQPAETQPIWRVARDGTTGCADAGALRLLREPAADPAALRRLAAARAEGGCVTVFRTSSWRLQQRTEDMLRLSPVEGAATGQLYFWRDQVQEDRGG
ncbi:hypothetical protein DFH01_06105 [Falsiroseomonas bella]|uniref:Lipoprotein n=1 Tax=Falsiroseomonas bella TaxID=2184016 RepID=A0A317FIH6_9PROT|nr:hypothetical protein [Falsiroseomonas bella]PWS38820.1 hypothetical protein DFH01_06105 [Falsiroseomonas bella]